MKRILLSIYDSQQILNLAGAFHIQADETIFLYHEDRSAFIHNAIIEKYCKNQVRYQKYDKDSLESIVQTICNHEDEIIIDVHGGEDYAIAYLSQLANDDTNVSIVYPDVEEKEFVYLYPKKGKEELKIPHLSVKDMIGLYGGAVRNLPESHFDEIGKKIVYFCLEERRKNKKRWHQFANIMSKASYRNKNSLQWNLDAKLANAYHEYFEGLESLQCIENVYENQTKLFFDIAKSDYIQLLTDVGVPFEYDVYYQLVESEQFDDVDIRVNIDWNGGVFEGYDPESELDVVATKDARMFSISCKSGDFDSMDLYEVKVNAQKFGGIRSIPVLCIDDLSRTPGYDEKARELDVVLIKGEDIRQKEVVNILLSHM